MRLYNTLTREKDEVKPSDGETLRIYTCGPTVYSTATIGNFRTYIFMDELRRVLKRNGFKLKHLMNITDVGHLTDDGDDGEDKLETAAKKTRKSPWQIAEETTAQFMADCKLLNIGIPEILARATEHINEMIDYVVKLQEKGHAYETSDGVYFDIMSIAGYGRLSRVNLEDNIAGARVEVGVEKRNPADFALWKKAPKEHIMQWQSPWGMGFPGWHIECSAMGLKYLGERFDIHTGGVDHIPIHHENEIAQSVGLLGHAAADMWVHSEFLLVDGGKMSKSLGNNYTLAQLAAREFDPLDYRYLCENAHYRTKLNFTFEGMAAAKTALKNLRALTASHKEGNAEVDITDYETKFNEAVNDDLNIPKALGIVWTAVKSAGKSHNIYDFILRCDQILALDLDREEVKREEAVNITSDIQTLIDARAAAKKVRNFAEADRIRDQLKSMGYQIIDTPGGADLKKL